MKTQFSNILITITIKLALFTSADSLHLSHNIVTNTKLSNKTKHNPFHELRNHIHTSTNITLQSNSSLNSIKDSPTIEKISSNSLVKDESDPVKRNSTFMNLIIEQTKRMKSEICNSRIDISNGFDKLINSVTLIKKKLKQITSVNVILKDEIILDFTICINNLNLIRAELEKMNNLLENIKKANCKDLTDAQNKSDQAKNNLNALVESIQNFLRKTNLDLNLLILT
jgi:hypothetical protein